VTALAAPQRGFEREIFDHGIEGRLSLVAFRPQIGGFVLDGLQASFLVGKLLGITPRESAFLGAML
jgi:hypothetical protein